MKALLAGVAGDGCGGRGAAVTARAPISIRAAHVPQMSDVLMLNTGNIVACGWERDSCRYLV